MEGGCENNGEPYLFENKGMACWATTKAESYQVSTSVPGKEAALIKTIPQSSRKLSRLSEQMCV